MIDLAVPRDIEPSVRDCPGIALYDMDDLQREVARNMSGRQAEAEEALVLVREEVARFEDWLGSLDVVPTISALRRRGDEIVEQVLRENESRWESLSEADRERVATMAQRRGQPAAARAHAPPARRRRRGHLLPLRARRARAVRARGRTGARTSRRPPRSPSSTHAASAAAGDPTRHARKRAGAGPGALGCRAPAR